MWTSTVRCLRSPRARSYFLRSSAISSCAVPSFALSAASACCFSCRRSSCLRKWLRSSWLACSRVSMRVCSSFERSVRISAKKKRNYWENSGIFLHARGEKNTELEGYIQGLCQQKKKRLCAPAPAERLVFFFKKNVGTCSTQLQQRTSVYMH
jgi:hypothetical protein